MLDPLRAAALALGLCGALLVAAPTASGARIKECGDQPSQLAYNITTRVVSCSEARRVTRSWNNGPARNGSGNGRVRGLDCRYRDTGQEAGDIRCTGAAGKVVRWQTYS